jgi:hypothetical protein
MVLRTHKRDADKIGVLLRKVLHMSKQLEDLTAKLTDLETVAAKTTDLLTVLAAKAAGADSPEALAALATRLGVTVDALNAAVAANTPLA